MHWPDGGDWTERYRVMDVIEKARQKGTIRAHAARATRLRRCGRRQVSWVQVHLVRINPMVFMDSDRRRARVMREMKAAGRGLWE